MNCPYCCHPAHFDPATHVLTCSWCNSRLIIDYLGLAEDEDNIEVKEK